MLTYLGHVDYGIRNTQYEAAQKFGDVFPLKAGREMKDGVSHSDAWHMRKMASGQGRALIGWLTQMRQSLSRKLCDVITEPIGKTVSLGKAHWML